LGLGRCDARRLRHQTADPWRSGAGFLRHLPYPELRLGTGGPTARSNGRAPRGHRGLPAALRAPRPWRYPPRSRAPGAHAPAPVRPAGAPPRLAEPPGVCLWRAVHHGRRWQAVSRPSLRGDPGAARAARTPDEAPRGLRYVAPRAVRGATRADPRRV